MSQQRELKRIYEPGRKKTMRMSFQKCHRRIAFCKRVNGSVSHAPDKPNKETTHAYPLTFHCSKKHIFIGAGKAEAKVHFINDLMKNEKYNRDSSTAN